MLIQVWCWSGEGSALLQLEDAVGPVILFEKWLDCWKPQYKGELLHKINNYLVPLVIFFLPSQFLLIRRVESCGVRLFGISVILKNQKVLITFLTSY